MQTIREYAATQKETITLSKAEAKELFSLAWSQYVASVGHANQDQLRRITMLELLDRKLTAQ